MHSECEIAAAIAGAERQELDSILLLGQRLEWNDGSERLAVLLARSWLRIRDREGQRIPLVPNRAQQLYEERRGQRNIVLKARQMGVSTWITGRFFLKTILVPGTLTVQVAHTQEAAEALFRMVHRFVESLPKELRATMRTSKSNVRQIGFALLDSEYRVESASDGNAGRGLTMTNLHASEVARWPGDAGETLQGLRAALAPSGELALESTPMGAGGCFWNEWQEAEPGGTVRHFFPWWLEPSYVSQAVCETMLTAEERQLMEVEGLSCAQISFRRQLKANFRGLAKQEYAESAEDCFLSSGMCVFEHDALAKLEREAREPREVQCHGQLRVWYPAAAGRRYVVAVDPAGGGAEGDWSAVQVVEVEQGIQCAELAAKMGGLELAREVEKLAREYNEALVVVERNNHGAAILAFLTTVCQYAKLYEQDGMAGWLTSAVSRPQMIAGMGVALMASPQAFLSRRLIRECRTFVRHRNGKIAAQYGEHDDCLMAMAIALAVRGELMLKK
ncbi:terminase [Silvibacterium dinghuense]|uniref:Terminase n=1 Tax=Silvibacterium dinghuense TaxID=1560006 RepID=A0A4Q1SJE1_9BACT|nr:terminase [Silvibacterium dinghuense]RXS97746.1 terminase [Silvibacterium dinghuense]GGH01663.1 terminase [Silvibacterium dinghuense]